MKRRRYIFNFRKVRTGLYEVLGDGLSLGAAAKVTNRYGESHWVAELSGMIDGRLVNRQITGTLNEVRAASKLFYVEVAG